MDEKERAFQTAGKTHDSHVFETPLAAVGDRHGGSFVVPAGAGSMNAELEGRRNDVAVEAAGMGGILLQQLGERNRLFLCPKGEKLPERFIAVLREESAMESLG